MLHLAKKNLHFTIPILLSLCILFTLGLWYITSISITKAETQLSLATSTLSQKQNNHGDYYVVVRLDTNTISLYNGTSTKTFNLVSQGKPGSYYETIGGAYTSDYKEPLHFSSIGHVFMPYSIHIFGNYFIHGIPYYPDGTKVSSTYSGGCVRISDEDIQYIYNFITPTTPIIITRGSEHDFAPTATTSAIMTSLAMTNLMVATISLEFLTQDNEIVNTDGVSTTTRKTILPLLLTNQDTNISTLYAEGLGEKNFLEAMNTKAKILGMTNTTFTQVTSPASTTEEDYLRFMKYIETYKSYLKADVRD